MAYQIDFASIGIRLTCDEVQTVCQAARQVGWAVLELRRQGHMRLRGGPLPRPLEVEAWAYPRGPAGGGPVGDLPNRRLGERHDLHSTGAPGDTPVLQTEGVEAAFTPGPALQAVRTTLRQANWRVSVAREPGAHAASDSPYAGDGRSGHKMLGGP